MHRALAVASLSVGLLAAAACGGKPGDDQVAALVRESVLAGWPQGSVDVREFRKTNGRSVSDSEYMAWVEYDIVFTRSSGEIKSELTKPVGSMRADEEKPAVAMQVMERMPQLLALGLMGSFEAGHTTHREATVSLIRTEQGWMLAPPAK